VDRAFISKRVPLSQIALLVWAGLLAACSGSSAAPTADPPASSASVTGSATPAGLYTMRSLTSNSSAIPAANTDSKLVNPWGIAFDPLGPVWIADNASNLSTLYIEDGVKFPLTVTIPAGTNGPAGPTGIVYNGSSSFKVSLGGLLSSPSQFIFAGLAGTITAWSEVLDTFKAVTVYDDGAGGAVYTGLALASNGGAQFLYAADFRNNKIDVFDSSFTKATPTSTGFIDPNLPSGYAPFGIQNIGGMLYVSYAAQPTTAGAHEDTGPGLGLVDLYSPDGTLQSRFASGGPLNAPWGMALAPADFGTFSNDLLVGNFGDGTINAFDPATGTYLGSLGDSSGQAIAIGDLWGLSFGNGLFGQATNSLFFTAGSNGETAGTYGSISPPKGSANSSSSGGSSSSSSSSSGGGSSSSSSSSSGGIIGY